MPAKSAKNLPKEVFEELSQEIPVDSVQQKKFGDKSNGYNIGYLIEVLNKTLIPRGWNWHVEILPIQLESESASKTFLIHEVKGTSGENSTKGKTTVSIHIRLTIIDENRDVVWAKESFGGCQLINKSLGDTLKGAQTDAMKKAFSYLGLGNEAFKGRIDDQLRQFYYRRAHIIHAITDFIATKYQKKATEGLILRYISSVVKKEYDDTDDVLLEDWELVMKSLGTKPATKEPKKDKATKKVPDEVTEEEVDESSD